MLEPYQPNPKFTPQTRTNSEEPPSTKLDPTTSSVETQKKELQEIQPSGKHIEQQLLAILKELPSEYEKKLQNLMLQILSDNQFHWLTLLSDTDSSAMHLIKHTCLDTFWEEVLTGKFTEKYNKKPFPEVLPMHLHEANHDKKINSLPKRHPFDILTGYYHYSEYACYQASIKHLQNAIKYVQQKKYSGARNDLKIAYRYQKHIKIKEIYNTTKPNRQTKKWPSLPANFLTDAITAIEHVINDFRDKIQYHLLRGEKHGNFRCTEALLFQNQYAIKQAIEEDNFEIDVQIEQANKRALEAANQHWASGFLLWSLFCSSAATYYKEKANFLGDMFDTTSVRCAVSKESTVENKDLIPALLARQFSNTYRMASLILTQTTIALEDCCSKIIDNDFQRNGLMDCTLLPDSVSSLDDVKEKNTISLLQNQHVLLANTATSLGDKLANTLMHDIEDHITVMNHNFSGGC